MPPPRFRLAIVLEFLLYAALTAFALHATWLTWPDAFIDFSRELYLPWRVSCGDVLYRDLAYYFGPVSVYVNAALFSLLGRPSIHALFVLNFAFWLATLLALRAILRRIASPLPATLAVSAFILLFSFSRYTGLGNDNFLAPYSHDLARGFLFALLALLALDSALSSSPGKLSGLAPDWGKSRRAPPVFSSLSAGFFYALVLFTKPELAFASTAALALLFVLRAWQRRTHSLRPLFFFSLAAFFTVVLVVAPFAVAFHSLSLALHDTLLKLYLDCFNPALTFLPYFKEVMGTDIILPHVLRLFLGASLAVIPFLLVRCLLPRLACRPLRLVATTLLALVAAALGWFAFFPLNAALPLAPVLFALLALRPSPLPKNSEEPGTRNPEPALPLAFSVFSFFLVSKIALNCGIGHYGFILALPAFCCAILLPFCCGDTGKKPSTGIRAIAPHPFPVRALCFSPLTPSKAASVVLLLSFTAAALHLQTATLRRWNVTHPVHDDSVLASPVDAQAFNEALAWIRTNTPPGSSLAALPEGAVLNVLSRRRAPNPYFMLEQGTYLRGTPSDILAAYTNAPPDTLALVQTAPPRFGIDYAQDLMAFLDAHYTPVFSVSPPASPSAPAPYLLIATRNSSMDEILAP